MAAVQLNFTLRTSTHCKTVHLLGSWDKYAGQLPLSKDSAKSGGWKGAFRFPPTTLTAGQRYWYYYIIDGHHVSHDPARDAVTEPTTGRKLNILDIPATTTAKSTATSKSSRHPRPASVNVVQGRALSPSQIQSPVPTKPHQTRQIATEKCRQPTVEELGRKLAVIEVSDSSEASDSDDSESAASDVPSLNSSRSTASSASSAGSACSCQRYGVTRGGARVKIDCGGARCGASSDVASSSSDDAASDCSSDSDVANNLRARTGVTRHHGVVVRK